MKIYFLQIPLILSCILNFLSYADTSPLNSENLRKSQVQILVRSDDSEQVYEGRGFFINNRVFVTSGFLALYMAQKNARIVITQEENFYEFNRIKNISLLHDLATIEIEGQNSSFLQISEEGSPKAVYLTPNIISHSKIKSLYLKTNRYFHEFTAPHIFEVDSLGGSPVLDPSGKVAGVFQFTSGGNYFMAVKSNILKKFLSAEFSTGVETPLPNIEEIINKELLNLLEKSLEGHALAQYKLSSYLFDSSISKYISKIPKLVEHQHINWLKKSAENLNPYAAFELSQKLRNVNPLVSFQMIKTAADQGFVPAFYALALIYLENDNRAKALHWNEKAAKSKYIPALIDMHTHFTESQTSTDHWIKEAAKVNSPIALHSLAVEALNQSQNASSFDEKKRLNTRGINLLKRSSDQNYPASQFLLGLHYDKGEHGLRSDKKKALLLVTRAANQGYHYAQIYLTQLTSGSEKVQTHCQKMLRDIRP